MLQLLSGDWRQPHCFSSIPNKNDAAGMEARKKKKSAQQAKRAQAVSAGHAEFRTAAQREMARVNFK